MVVTNGHLNWLYICHRSLRWKYPLRKYSRLLLRGILAVCLKKAVALFNGVTQKGILFC